MELAELAERSLVSYLAGLVKQDGSPVWPVTMQRGAGQNFSLRIFAGETDETKDGQNIFCAAEKDFPEHIPSSGIYEVPCRVVLRTPTRKLTDGEKNAPQSILDPLATHSAAADALQTAMMANGLELSLTPPYVAGQTNGFTCWGILDRVPGRDQNDAFWESSLSLRLVCSASSWPN